MTVEYPASGHSWIAGTPWRDMRIHAGISSGTGERSMPVHGYQLLNRDPEWVLTSAGRAGFRVPAMRSELRDLPGDSGRISFASHFSYGQPWILVVCDDTELESVFLRFCETVLIEISGGARAVDSLQRVLHRFRQLFEVVQESVSSERIVGLIAELMVLKWLLESDIDAIPGWLGPTGETHDFVLGKNHLEVKALRASGARVFHVSNIDQMEPPPAGELFLLGVRLVPGGETVGGLCDQIRDMIGPDRAEQFEASLRLQGITGETVSQWNRLGADLGSLDAWSVTDAFPRLVRSMLAAGELAPGISGVNYDVSLEHAGACEIRKDKILHKLTGASQE